jgi:2-phosphosulfolactate phosphatase
MSRTLAAHFLPALVEPDELAGGAVVVIDVLRASTVITCALAAGAREVIPCLEVVEARQIAAGLPAGQAVLGGERGGLKIEGFDLGNSPSEYRPDTVGSRTVVFTTTNGTRAMNACRGASRVLIGAFVNFTALCETLPAEGPIHLLCAGTKGKITREDVLFAGAVAERLTATVAGRAAVDENALNDQARIARAAWREALRHDSGCNGDVPSWAALAAELRLSQGGRNLKAIGLDRDIDDVARLDSLKLIAELDLAAWRIRPIAPR